MYEMAGGSFLPPAAEPKPFFDVLLQFHYRSDTRLADCVTFAGRGYAGVRLRLHYGWRSHHASERAAVLWQGREALLLWESEGPGLLLLLQGQERLDLRVPVWQGGAEARSGAARRR